MFYATACAERSNCSSAPRFHITDSHCKCCNQLNRVGSDRQVSNLQMSHLDVGEPQMLLDSWELGSIHSRTPVDPRRLGRVFNDEEAGLQLANTATLSRLPSSRKMSLDVADLRYIDDDGDGGVVLDTLGGGQLVNTATAPLAIKRSPSRRHQKQQLHAATDLELSHSAPATPIRRQNYTSASVSVAGTGRRKRGQIEEVGALGVGGGRAVGHSYSPLLSRFVRGCEGSDSDHHQHHKKGAARIGDASCSKKWGDNQQPMEPAERSFLMHNKQPIWNEQSQVYQLDFGGRVTQESAKNFQIEADGVQVLQFGRLSSSTFTLDFQYPFSPVQAFGVALANLTQRLK